MKTFPCFMQNEWPVLVTVVVPASDDTRMLTRSSFNAELLTLIIWKAQEEKSLSAVRNVQQWCLPTSVNKLREVTVTNVGCVYGNSEMCRHITTDSEQLQMLSCWQVYTVDYARERKTYHLNSIHPLQYYHGLGFLHFSHSQLIQ
jgi:hypothetical protein